MERLYRPNRIIRERIPRHCYDADDPIELDNKAFDIKDGAGKSLGYLDYYSTLAKGDLAARGVIKLCPACKGKFIEHYGATAPPFKKAEIPPDLPSENDDDIDNEWNNIFLNRDLVQSY